ncbi:hypothetical protein [Burkholderia oklahomensis]|uniref:hypothetical protein n=1 Tax=Burkholderia oklahomensis TaxID=342113 RepID=UPI00016A9084|nr:hypothetical protein [Burkholderia oklahomensis]AOI45744.1 hypothetical protein WI23_08065 [Burkholderia oklahomensis C6786]KUY51190.1 hypothetical protein WI23_25940 [Burkholderia oklahomensis C6786]MBI0361723.1 hypothetical protein [Burkholderia oklahomensis]
MTAGRRVRAGRSRAASACAASHAAGKRAVRALRRIASIERGGFPPSLAHLAAALKKPRALDIGLSLPMHGPAIDARIPELVARLSAYCAAGAGGAQTR